MQNLKRVRVHLDDKHYKNAQTVFQLKKTKEQNVYEVLDIDFIMITSLIQNLDIKTHDDFTIKIQKKDDLIHIYVE